MKKIQIRKITLTALLAALSSILYYFVKFPLALLIPIIPPFLEVNFSMVPVLLGGYMVGPLYGVIVVLIRFLVKLPSTHTACVGELADLLIGVLAVLVTSIIYKKLRTKIGAFISLGSGCLTWVITSLFVNAFILIPTYIQLYFNGNVDGLVNMLSNIPGITAENYLFKYVLYGALPFNTILSLTICIITFVVYKPLHKLISNMANRLTKKDDKEIDSNICKIVKKSDIKINIEIIKK